MMVVTAASFADGARRVRLEVRTPGRASRGRPLPALRALLHHQAAGPGHGAGPVAVPGDRGEPRGDHRGGERGGEGRALPRRAAPAVAARRGGGAGWRTSAREGRSWWWTTSAHVAERAGRDARRGRPPHRRGRRRRPGPGPAAPEHLRPGPQRHPHARAGRARPLSGGAAAPPRDVAALRVPHRRPPRPETGRFLATAGAPSLAKPFHLDEVLSVVRRMLQAR